MPGYRPSSRQVGQAPFERQPTILPKMTFGRLTAWATLCVNTAKRLPTSLDARGIAHAVNSLMKNVE